MILAAFWGDIFFYLIEFRPENLWALCSLLSLIGALDGHLSPRRALRAGLIFGFAIGVSTEVEPVAGESLVAALLTPALGTGSTAEVAAGVAFAAAFGCGALRRAGDDRGRRSPRRRLVPLFIIVSRCTIFSRTFTPNIGNHGGILIFPCALPVLAALGWWLWRGGARSAPRLAPGLRPPRGGFELGQSLRFLGADAAGLSTYPSARLRFRERAASAPCSIVEAIRLVLRFAWPFPCFWRWRKSRYLLAVRPLTRDQTLLERESIRAVLRLTSPGRLRFGLQRRNGLSPLLSTR